MGDQVNVDNSETLSAEDITQDTKTVDNLFQDQHVADIKFPISWPPFSKSNSLPNVLSEFSKEESYKSIHPKHLENQKVIYHPDIHEPSAESNGDNEKSSEKDFLETILYQEKQDINGNTEIDIASQMVLDETQKQLHSKLYSGLKFYEFDPTDIHTDTIYTPHTGPWDIPQEDGSMQNIVINGDWNDGELWTLYNTHKQEGNTYISWSFYQITFL